MKRRADTMMKTAGAVRGVPEWQRKEHWYYGPGSRKIRARRMTMLDRLRIRKRRRMMDDLAGLNGRRGV